jgi:hypothetical protein
MSTSRTDTRCSIAIAAAVPAASPIANEGGMTLAVLTALLVLGQGHGESAASPSSLRTSDPSSRVPRDSQDPPRSAQNTATAA